MLRAFGKMTQRARKCAGEFRAQFDEALREADMDDVRQTLNDAQKLNPPILRCASDEPASPDGQRDQGRSPALDIGR